MAMESGYTVISLARDVTRLEAEVGRKVSRREHDALKADVDKVEAKLDQVIANQLANQRTAIWQLAAIIVTLAVAAYGAIG